MKHERTPGSAQKTWHEERRGTVRVPVDQVVAYTAHASKPIIAKVSELSNASFRIVANEIIPVGTKVTIAFPAGALLSRKGASRVHVFGGWVVHASPQGGQFRYGVDLFENTENVDDLRWTVLQLSLRRTAREWKERAGSAPASIAPVQTLGAVGGLGRGQSQSGGPCPAIRTFFAGNARRHSGR